MNKFASNELSRYYDMIEDIRTERSKVSGRIENSSFYRIPAVKNFDIRTKEPNELLKGTGFDRKLKAEFDYEIFGDNNIGNKYMKREIKYLRNVRHKPHVFWAHVAVLMKHSMAFRVSAFNKVHHGGYKELSVERIFQITYGMNKIIESATTNLQYFRVEIPKDGPKAVLQGYLDNPGGKYNKTRPLGVPTAPGRVILHMGNGFLVLFLEDELKQFNHAYTPNVGTMTCLKEGVKVVLPKKYIYEFDFKGFFNNVRISKVIELLEERGMPKEQSERLYRILQKAPKNMKLGSELVKTDYDTSLMVRNLHYDQENLNPYEGAKQAIEGDRKTNPGKGESEFLKKLGPDKLRDIWLEDEMNRFSYEYDTPKRRMADEPEIPESLKEFLPHNNELEYATEFTNAILNMTHAEKRKQAALPVRMGEIFREAKAVKDFYTGPIRFKNVKLVSPNKKVEIPLDEHVYEEPHHIIDVLQDFKDERLDKGLPQGAAPSTTLSLLALVPGYEELKRRDIGLLMYADDGFLYSDEPFEPFEPEGLEFAPEKSHGLVRDGKPQVDKVKFLGVEYSFKDNMIAAKTREGSRLQFGDAQYYVIDHYLEEVRRPGPQSRSWYNVHFDPKNLEHFASDLETQDGSKGEEQKEHDLKNKANAVYEVAEELREGGNDRLEKLVNSGIGGLALSKLYGGQGGKQFFPVKTPYEENSGGGTFYNIRELKQDLKLQRLASTIACEWLIEHMTQMTTSIKKAKKYATHALRFFKPMREEVKEQLMLLRQEVEMENYGDSKKLSLVPYNSESQNSSEPRSPGPVRLTKRERKTLRRSLMSEDQRKQGRPNAPILSEAEFKKLQLKKRSKSVKPKGKTSPKKAPRTLW